MLRRAFAFVACLTVCGDPSLVAGDTPISSPVPIVSEGPLWLGLETWISTGDSHWDISFLQDIPQVGVVRGRSKLEWEDMDSVVVRLRGEYRLSPLLRVSASYGVGEIRGGENTDTDWISGPDLNDFLLARSVAKTTGDVQLFEVTAYWRLNEWMDLSRVGGLWDLFIGYQYHQEDLRDRHGILTIDREQPVHIPFAALDSTYSFEWQSVRFGVRGEVALSQRFHVAWLFAALAGEYRGEGFWNLRDDFIADSPNFVHRASATIGGEMRTSMRYDITSVVHAEIGVWSIRMRAKNGTDTTYFADGDVGVANLDNVRTKREGMFLSLGARF